MPIQLDQDNKVATIYKLRAQAGSSGNCVVCGALKPQVPGHLCPEHFDWTIQVEGEDRGEVESVTGDELPKKRSTKKTAAREDAPLATDPIKTSSPADEAQ